jgi:putative SOS response-associated peptidase YedK
MCGRYQLRSGVKKIATVFHLEDVDAHAVQLAPNYNAAPGTTQPVIVWDEQFGVRTLQMMFWRFLPPFVIDPKKFRLDTINAKGETLMNSSVWRESFLYRRCLVPVDTFIEWQRIDNKTKLPWMFAMKDDKLFALGGVWRRWWSPDNKSQMDTFAIITTEPNELLTEKTGHDRMPVIIKSADPALVRAGADRTSATRSDPALRFGCDEGMACRSTH